MGIPLIRAAAPRAILSYLRQIRAPVERLLAQVGLSPRILEDSESLVPFGQATRLLELAARAEGIDDLGARMMEQLGVGAMGAFGRRVEQAATLQEAIDTARRSFPGFNSAVRGWIVRQDDEVRIHHRLDVPGESPQWAAAALMAYVRLIRSVAGPAWYPRQLEMPTRSLPGWRQIPVLANARIEFGRPAIAISIPAALLDRPLPRRRGGAPVQEPANWDLSAPAPDFAGSIRQIVAGLLADGYPGLGRVAEVAGMSARTLQRRLGAEQLTYGRVVAQARLDVARRLLADPERKLIEVAYDLGYSDPAHFSRAFRAWTGFAPRVFRQRYVRSVEPSA